MKIEKRTAFQRVVFIIVFILFAIYALSLVYPFLWSMYNSIKPLEEYKQNSFTLPTTALFSNYAEAFRKLKEYDKLGFIGMLINSILLVGLTTGFAVLGSACAAYVVSKFKFKGSKFIYTAAVFIMVVPTAGLTPALYKMLSEAKLTDSIIVTSMIQGGCFGMYFMLMYGTFETLSWTYAEAGYMDGANDFTIFFRIMIPQVAGQCLALSLVCAIGIWNDYFYPWVFMPNKYTISTGLFRLQSDLIDSPTTKNPPVYFAALLVCCIPMLVVFTCFQNTLMNNTSAGGIKG